MRVAILGFLLVSLAPLTSEARPFKPGAAFTATLQSDTTGATATMTWRTDRICVQGPLVRSGRPQFVCPGGRWDCDGAACPARRGRLTFLFDPDGLHEATLFVSRRSLCIAHFVGFGQGPQQPPYHWLYQCFTLRPTKEFDSGPAVVDLKPTS